MRMHFIFVDEGNMALDRRRDSIEDVGPGQIMQLISQVRELGEGVLASSQMPVNLSDGITSNVYGIICMSQSGGKNIQEMARAMNLDKDQIERMAQLVSDKDQNLFEAIVRMSGRWLKPFVIEVDPLDVEKKISDHEVNRYMQPLIDDLNKRVVPRTSYKQILEMKRKEAEAQKKQRAEEKKREEVPESKTEKSETEKKESPEWQEKAEGNVLIKILTNIREYPFIDQQKRIQMLNLPSSSSSTVNKYFKEIVFRGYVHVHRIGFGKGQGTKVFYEITEKGREFARMQNFILPGKGDFQHKLFQNIIRIFFESMHYKAEVEKRFGTKNVDVGVMDGSKQIAVEIELSADHLIQNIQADLEAGCNTIIVAVKSKASISTYRKKIQNLYDEEILKRIDFRVLSDFLT